MAVGTAPADSGRNRSRVGVVHRGHWALHRGFGTARIADRDLHTAAWDVLAVGEHPPALGASQPAPVPVHTNSVRPWNDLPLFPNEFLAVFPSHWRTVPVSFPDRTVLPDSWQARNRSSCLPAILPFWFHRVPFLPPGKAKNPFPLSARPEFLPRNLWNLFRMPLLGSPIYRKNPQANPLPGLCFEKNVPEWACPKPALPPFPFHLPVLHCLAADRRRLSLVAFGLCPPQIAEQLLRQALPLKIPLFSSLVLRR